jgi:hypothetical protein
MLNEGWATRHLAFLVFGISRESGYDSGYGDDAHL